MLYDFKISIIYRTKIKKKTLVRQSTVFLLFLIPTIFLPKFKSLISFRLDRTHINQIIRLNSLSKGKVQNLKKKKQLYHELYHAERWQEQNVINNSKYVFNQRRPTSQSGLQNSYQSTNIKQSKSSKNKLI